MATGNTTHQVLFALGWTIDEMSRLNEDGRKLLVQCKVIMEQHATLSVTGDIVGINIPRQLADLRSRCIVFQGCYSFKAYCCNPFDGIHDQS